MAGAAATAGAAAGATTVGKASLYGGGMGAGRTIQQVKSRVRKNSVKSTFLTFLGFCNSGPLSNFRGGVFPHLSGCLL